MVTVNIIHSRADSKRAKEHRRNGSAKRVHFRQKITISGDVHGLYTNCTLKDAEIHCRYGSEIRDEVTIQRIV